MLLHTRQRGVDLRSIAIMWKKAAALALCAVAGAERCSLFYVQESLVATCGQSDIDCAYVKYAKLAQAGLKDGTCASQGYTVKGASSTATYPFVGEVTITKYTKPVRVASCADDFSLVFSDMHDGDKKSVELAGTQLTIKPSGNNQTWSVVTTLDKETCAATVDFRVPGKPSPPPVSLQATVWTMLSPSESKLVVEFTDPTGTLAPATKPLNAWIQTEIKSAAVVSQRCDTEFNAVYSDMHDGDQKKVVLAGTELTITPFGNDQTWSVVTSLDKETCAATVDFRVPGKPSPPPVSLEATIYSMMAPSQSKLLIEFSDPSGTIAAKTMPLNAWIQTPVEVGTHLQAAPACSLFFVQESQAVCGQSDIDCKYVKYAKLAQAGLKDGTCPSQGYTVKGASTTNSYPFIGSVTITKYTKPADLLVV